MSRAYNWAVISDRAALAPVPDVAVRLAWVHGADDLTFFRLQRLLKNVGLRAERVSSGKADDRAETPTVALVVVAGAAQWRSVARLCRRFDTVVLAPEPNLSGEERALELGAIGYLALDLGDIPLGRTISRVLAGETAFSRVVLGKWLRGRSAATITVDTPELTARQQQVLALIARGNADKQIAGHLGIATATVNKHVQALLRKLSVPNRAAAVRYENALKVNETA